jgi:hypothetical protein
LVLQAKHRKALDSASVGKPFAVRTTNCSAAPDHPGDENSMPLDWWTVVPCRPSRGSGIETTLGFYHHQEGDEKCRKRDHFQT